MNNLINGKDVLIALAKGEEVEFKCCCTTKRIQN